VDVTAENDERSDMVVRNDTTIDGVMQMLQTMTPPYVRYLRGEQPWPETGGLWPFGKERRQAARHAKAGRIAREALNRPDIHALVLRQAQDIPADAFQAAELLIRAIMPHVLAKWVALPLDPYVFALLAEQIQQVGRAYFEQRVTQYD
jgi:hypothetical protein